MKQFLKKNKKTILNLLLLVLVVALLSLAATAILLAFGVLYFDNGIQLNFHLFDSFQNTWFGWLIVLAAQVILTTVLCFVPGTTMTFLILIPMLYDRLWQAFLIAFIGVMLSSVIMYLTGRYGGRRLCERILGKKDCEKASDLLNRNGVAFFPVMMLFPMFPDDALVMIAGTLKMPLKWFLPSILFGRGIGVASIILGLGSIPYEKFTTPLHWIVFILIAALFIAGVLLLTFKLQKHLKKKEEKNSKKGS